LDIPIHFIQDPASKDFAERKANDEFADNCIYVVENLNFQPEEFGYIAPLPKTEEDDAVSKGEEGAEDESTEPEEGFNQRTTHQLKHSLGIMGDIYVNDAPMASLSTSTTVNEIKCPKKVMGMKMSEELRSIAQFFLKEFPLDIDSIYHQMPDKNLEYYTIKSTAIIGGICKSSSDILEKVVLANSFLDTFQQIIFVGEMGLVMLHSLGLYAGKVERSADNSHEYDKIKEFVLTLFNNSVLKGCKLILPQDFVSCQKDSL